MTSFVDTVIKWFAGARGGLRLDKQVHISVQGTSYGDRTAVRIDHRIPAVGGGNDGWRITTNKQFLPLAHFDRRVREKINQAALERGRRLYCIDLSTGEVIAAMSYHIDNSTRLPVFLTALGLRIDATPTGDLYDRSRGGAYLLKQYVHEIAQQIERDGYVHVDADNVDAIRDLTDLGFRRAPNLRGFRASGTHMRQPPLQAEED